MMGRTLSVQHLSAICAVLLGFHFATPSLAQDAHHVDHGEHTNHTTDDSRAKHIPPDPPQTMLGDMSNARMIELMGMDDRAPHTMVMFDQLEWRELHDEDALAWDAYAWFGGDYHKLWLKSEGDYVDDYAARHELLWDRIFSRWWSVQAGIRHDVSAGPSRTWLAVGLQGLAPHWFEVEATAYIGEQGRTALRASFEQDVLLTQRLVLTPELELSLYGQDDEANGIGSGLSDIDLGVRLRYEITREVAPYVGVVWTRLYGSTADFAQAAGRDEDDVQAVVGIRGWF